MSDSNTSPQRDSNRLFIFSVRIPVRDEKSRKSSVSMDGFLAECLIGVLGNHAEANKWVEAHAIQFREEAEHDKDIRRVGVSRLVQRAALKLVLEKRAKQ